MKRVESAALLVRSVAFGEADSIVTLFTETLGKASAVVRGARRSSKRFAGALEPMHTLVVALEDKGKELLVLKESRLSRARVGLVSDLDAMEAAGQALRWVRHLCPPRTPEPGAFASLEVLLDALDRAALAQQGGLAQEGGGGARAATQGLLAAFGLGLLAEVGYAIELTRCVRCGRACPEGRAAYIDAAGGGIVCSSCGGARRQLGGPLRAIAVALQRGEPVAPLSRQDAAELVSLVEESLAVHADFDPARLSR